MLTLISGPYSGLEHAFFDRVQELKKENPWGSLLAVAPSSRLLGRLEQVLAEADLSILNLHFDTFSSLAEKIVSNEDLTKPILSDSLFYQTLIKIILKQDKPFRRLSELAVPEGFPFAVAATLRDLLDAGAPPQISEAVKEGFLGKDVDVGSLRELLRLYRIYVQKIQSLPVMPWTEITKKATALAPTSRYLSRFQEILYYGFYDLTGVQADFFQAVVKHHPCRFYFPYVSAHPAFLFAKRFRDNFIQPVLKEEITVELENPPAAPDFKVFNVSGLHDEAWVVAQEILRCHKEDKIPFSEMAIIARSRDRLGETLLSALDDHHIPYRPASRLPLGRSPKVQMALELLSQIDQSPAASETDFMRDAEFHWPEGTTAFPGPQEWPAQSPWSGYVDRVTALLQTHFTPQRDDSKRIWAAMLEALKTLRAFDHLKGTVAWSEFLETLKVRWSDLKDPETNMKQPGVSVLYAEAARGLSFTVVFLIGAEERVFPRVIREDPFLRDDARLALSNTLGYKVFEKMTALEEERLLFHLFVSAARQKIVFVYQRSDQEGAVVGSSPFLREFVESQGLALEAVEKTIPRPYVLKLKESRPNYLDQRAIVSCLIQGGHRKQALVFLQKAREESLFLKRQLEFADEMQSTGRPGAIDGLLGAVPLSALFKGGRLSPTSLEIYGECPFQFFAVKMLGLEPLEKEEMLEALAPDIRGELIHGFLEKFYKRLFSGNPKSEIRNPKFNSLFEQTFNEVFGVQTPDTSTVPPVLWEALRLNLKEQLKKFVERDLAECESEGFIPAYFEQDVLAPLDPPLHGFPWFGRMDRIDIGKDKARVVDYKTGRFHLANKVSTLALRGRRLQPPIYILLAERFLKKQEAPAKRVSFLYKRLDEEENASGLFEDELAANRNEISKTIATQMELLQKGAFPIFPDEGTNDGYCGHCTASPICRKSYAPTVYRARQGPGEVLRAIREKRSAKGQAR